MVEPLGGPLAVGVVEEPGSVSPRGGSRRVVLQQRLCSLAVGVHVCQDVGLGAEAVVGQLSGAQAVAPRPAQSAAPGRGVGHDLQPEGGLEALPQAHRCVLPLHWVLGQE